MFDSEDHTSFENVRTENVDVNTPYRNRIYGSPYSYPTAVMIATVIRL